MKWNNRVLFGGEVNLSFIYLFLISVFIFIISLFSPAGYICDMKPNLTILPTHNGSPL